MLKLKLDKPEGETQMSEVMSKFEEAFLKTQNEHSCLERKTGREIIATLEGKLNEEASEWFPGNFESHLHNTLNLFNLYQDKRIAYRALAINFFSNRRINIQHDK